MKSEEFFEEMNNGVAGEMIFSFGPEEISGISLNDSTPTGVFISDDSQKTRYIVTNARAAKVAMKIVCLGDDHILDCLELGYDNIDFGKLLPADELKFSNAGDYCWGAKILRNYSNERELAVACVPSSREYPDVVMLIPRDPKYDRIDEMEELAGR